MKVKKGSVLMVVVALILGLTLYAGATESEFRIKFGVLSHWDSLFGNYSVVVGGDYLLHLEDSPFGIVGGLEYTSSVRTIFCADIFWRDITMILSFLHFPTLAREVYLGMGLGYHWVTKEVIYRYIDYRRIQKDSALGLHVVIGFNLGKHTFLEGKISSFGIGNKNKGGISLQIGGRF